MGNEMKIIHNKEELLDYVGDTDAAYDVDASWVIEEVDYEYPIVLLFQGHTHLGAGYKVMTVEEIKGFVEQLKELL